MIQSPWRETLAGLAGGATSMGTGGGGASKGFSTAVGRPPAPRRHASSSATIA